MLEPCVVLAHDFVYTAAVIRVAKSALEGTPYHQRIEDEVAKFPRSVRSCIKYRPLLRLVGGEQPQRVCRQLREKLDAPS
jgi:hypothetical protein